MVTEAWRRWEQSVSRLFFRSEGSCPALSVAKRSQQSTHKPDSFLMIYPERVRPSDVMQLGKTARSIEPAEFEVALFKELV
jgi:hypothetical protein